MTLHAFTDGASRGNPGESGIGLLVRTDQGQTVLTLSAYIGVSTNNIAEYTALLTLLQKIQAMGCTRLVVHTDSELMVRQMKGEYRIRNAEIRKLYDRITELVRRGRFRFEIIHIARETNREADELANLGIDSRKPIEA